MQQTKSCVIYSLSNVWEHTDLNYSSESWSYMALSYMAYALVSYGYIVFQTIQGLHWQENSYIPEGKNFPWAWYFLPIIMSVKFSHYSFLLWVLEAFLSLSMPFEKKNNKKSQPANCAVKEVSEQLRRRQAFSVAAALKGKGRETA